MMEGKEFKDVGHAHAMKFAMDFLNSMSDRWPLLAPAKAFGAHGALYRAGFLAGLQFFENNPVYRGE